VNERGMGDDIEAAQEEDSLEDDSSDEDDAKYD
jgi:hypothetical protein